MEPVDVVVPAADVLWAHPVAILALPAFIPVVVIVVTILWVARNDRRAEAQEALAAADDPTAALEAPTASSPEEPATVPAGPAGPTPTGAEEPATEPRRSWRDRMPRLVIGDDED